MPSRFFLSYAVTNILVNEIRDGFTKDHDLFRTDNDVQTRIQMPKVLDGWNYTLREFPCVIIPSVPGTNRRMGIGDFAPTPYFGVSATEDQAVATTTYRKFIVSNVLYTGLILNVTYSGDDLTVPSEWSVPVKEETVGSLTRRYVELTGTVGPNTTYPRENFSFISSTSPTAEQYGGFFDLRPEIFVVALSQIEREIVLDKLWTMLWFSKKRELLYKGVVVLDVSYGGATQEDYGADKLYVGKMSLSCATEFRQLVYYLDTVEGIKIQGEAMLPSVTI
jgi:hypothetical protein